MALALIRAHNPDVKIHEVATTKHPGVEPDDFFEDVKEDAKFIIGLCDLDEIQE